MDIVRKTIRDGYYTVELTQLVDDVNMEINMELEEAMYTGRKYDYYKMPFLDIRRPR
jgi:hypothetical protein